jgi:hypothetical protein
MKRQPREECDTEHYGRGLESFAERGRKISFHRQSLDGARCGSACLFPSSMRGIVVIIVPQGMIDYRRSIAIRRFMCRFDCGRLVAVAVGMRGHRKVM